MATNIKGLADLKRNLRQVGKSLHNFVISEALKEGSKTIQKAAKANAGKDTGILKRSIRVYKRRGDSPSQVYFAVFAGASVSDKKRRARYRLKSNTEKADPYYARFHQMGTRYTSANPFMTKALQDNAQAAIDVIADVVRREVMK